MEDKQLNSVESIALIQRMITATREKYEKGGGTLFLIWGYTSLAVSILVTALVFITENEDVNWFWWLIPVVGYSCMTYVFRKRTKPVRTYIDKFIGYVWLTIGIAAMLYPAIGMFYWVADMMIIPIESLLLSIGVVLTGLVIKFKPLTIGGFIAMGLSYLMLFLHTGYVYVFMAMFVVAMIIPGHILNYRGRCSKH